MSIENQKVRISNCILKYYLYNIKWGRFIPHNVSMVNEFTYKILVFCFESGMNF